MARENLQSLIGQVGADGFVSQAEVLQLRRVIFQNGVVDRDELAALFQLGERAPSGDRQWPEYFAEAAGDFFLREEQPQGYLTEKEFTEIKALVTRDGAHASMLEVGLLVRLMETATSIPEGMTSFTAEQILQAIQEKAGGAVVDADDVSLISRLVFAAGGDGNVAITKAEAEFLFDVSDAVANADNDPSWPDFFKRAIANHLMAHIGRDPVSRNEALGLYARTANNNTDAAPSSTPKLFKSDAMDMLLRVVSTKAAHRRRVEQASEAINARREAAAADAEKITAQEADWLVARIGRDGVFHAAEKALIAHLQDLGAQIPEALQECLDAA